MHWLFHYLPCLSIHLPVYLAVYLFNYNPYYVHS